MIVSMTPPGVGVPVTRRMSTRGAVDAASATIVADELDTPPMSGIAAPPPPDTAGAPGCADLDAMSALTIASICCSRTVTCIPALAASTAPPPVIGGAGGRAPGAAAPLVDAPGTTSPPAPAGSVADMLVIWPFTAFSRP
jgi:hypothetical protein